MRAMKGYLRIDKDTVTGKYVAAWYYDPDDLDETTIVLDFKKIYMAADQNGKPIPEYSSGEDAVSTSYRNIGVDPPAEIRSRVQELLQEAERTKRPATFWTVRGNQVGERFQIRAGIVYGEGHGAPYYVAIGTPLAQYRKIQSEFTWIYVGIISAAIILGSFLGWFMAGRALALVL